MNDGPTLRQHLEKLLEAERTLNDQRFSEIRSSTEFARQGMEKRLDSMNEFRAALQDSNNKFVSRVEFDTRIESLIQRIGIAERSIWMASGALALLVLVVPVVIHNFFR
jgi:hypothetical protein